MCFIKRKGYTLIETILAVTILAIICVGMMPMLTSSLNMIKTSGQRNIAQYTSQKAVEDYIAGNNNNFPNTTLKITSQDIILNFGGNSFTVAGSKVDSIYNDGKQSFTVTTFIPK